MKVFVTGWAGYIGVHLVELLKKAGHQVTGCDLELFEGCDNADITRPDKEVRSDVRSLTTDDLSGHDCVMHLAAISNDPMGALRPELTLSVNRDGTEHVARCAKKAGIPRFLFSSSCSIYGKSADGAIDENGTLSPLSAYAQSKVESEKILSALADKTFCPVYLRNATAYGYSPMFRTDLVVNNLVGTALAYGEIRVQSDGTPWRPLAHCRDIARAFIAIMEAPTEKVFNTAINIGGNSENYQVLDIANTVGLALPSTQIVFAGEAAPDPRDYKVNFDLLGKLLPEFTLEYNLQLGVQELVSELEAIGFNKEDFSSEKYVRLRTLNTRMKQFFPEEMKAAI